MKYDYILTKMAQQTYTASRMYDKNLSLRLHKTADPDFHDEELVRDLLSRREIHSYRGQVPLLFSVDNRIAYAWVTNKDGFFLLGPTKFHVYLDINLKLTSRVDMDTSQLCDSIPFYNIGSFSEDILLLHNLYKSGTPTDPYLDINSMLAANCKTDKDFSDAVFTLYNKVFSDVENNTVHNPFNHEKRQVASIRNGDPELLADILEERFPGRYGVLSEDPLKQEIYIGIVETTLASRAAIEGGLHPEMAFTLSDITIQKLDQCRNTISAMVISREMQMQYARLVQEQKKMVSDASTNTENIHISHCKDYIFAHLHGRLTVKEIASAVGLEENYLSSLFKRYEHMTLSAYILQEKIKLAKNLLTYSSYSFIEIATYLGFSSQSHFGQVFKKNTGITPRAFRDANASEDFLNDTMPYSDEN